LPVPASVSNTPFGFVGVPNHKLVAVLVDDLAQVHASVPPSIELFMPADFGDRDQPDRGIVITSIGGS
jgi:hypothetical protein